MTSAIAPTDLVLLKTLLKNQHRGNQFTGEKTFVIDL